MFFDQQTIDLKVFCYGFWVVRRLVSMVFNGQRPSSMKIDFRNDVCSLFFYCKKRLEYLNLLNHCTMGKLQWEVGHRNFSLLREKYIWNIWTRIKWEAKLTNLSELFGRC